ncbi:MAG: 2Fe-2S iron-sulfur cluster-binding protein [Firmicutes bacterium]|nr:2Fe-2S iron-sulfur cluster-binding protein [Bacillota bacterium]
MDKQNNLKVKVYRFDPSVDKEPYYKDYEVPFQYDKMKILDVLRFIQEKLDGSLSFTWDCRLWNCGLCGITVNKKSCSACLVDVKNIIKNNSLLIEPMSNYSIIKDLVIDRTVEIKQMQKLGIKYDRNNGEFSLDNIPEVMDPEKVAFLRDWYLACIDCLVCNSACPAFSSDYGFIGPHLSVRLAKYLNHPKDEGDRPNQGYAGGIFQCLGCRRCDMVCPLSLEVSSNTMEQLKTEAIENGHAPPEVKNFLKNVFKYGNPWGMPSHDRAQWANDLGVSSFNTQKHNYLMFVGCTGSYDPRAQETTKSLAKLLMKAELTFGILGEKEVNDGNEVSRVGEKGLFEHLAEQNIENFSSLQVEKIVTLSPHSFNTIKNEYPNLGGQYEVIHYTQLLRDLIYKNILKPTKKIKGKVAFHDPCFLGRYNNEYDAPREILKAIPGLEPVEMERIKENSFCCGGGGANSVTDLISRKNRPSTSRIKEAYATGANILAVSCPICLTMFEDAVKDEGLENIIVVKDIAELLLESLAD